VSVRALSSILKEGFDIRLVITDTQRIADWDSELADYRNQIKALVGELGMSQSVAFASADYATMPALYDEADIVIYPTVGEEPFGLVPLEAMAMERPIVASRSGGISESIVDGTTGFLTERGDVAQLADRLITLLSDTQMALEMGQRGRAHVVENFSLAAYVDRLRAAYESDQ
jgi:glycosyltransferase involved in cell wall biosynthesis